MPPSLSFADEREIDAFVDSFAQCTLPKEGWTHAAHLVVGLWHILHYPKDDVLPILRTRIRAYNQATGVANTDTGGYHETITRFFVVSLGEFLAAQRSVHSQSPDLFAALLRSPLADKGYPLKFYSRDLLDSVQARRTWVEPHLR